MALGRLAADFRAAYPEVEVKVVAEDRLANLVDEQFDVAIRINPGNDTALVGRCFARDRLILAAAPSIPMPQARSGKPPRVPAIVMPTYRDGELWSVGEGELVVQPEPVLRLSSLLTVRDAVAAGAGAAMLPQSIIGEALKQGALVSWGAANGETELWILHTSRRLQSPKVRAFVEFMCAQYPDGSFVVRA